MSKRATDELLNELHGLQARSMLDEIKRFKHMGEPIPPALFAQINKYLKDNGVDRPAHPGCDLDRLDEELPVFEDNVVTGDFGDG